MVRSGPDAFRLCTHVARANTGIYVKNVGPSWSPSLVPIMRLDEEVHWTISQSQWSHVLTRDIHSRRHAGTRIFLRFRSTLEIDSDPNSTHTVYISHYGTFRGGSKVLSRLCHRSIAQMINQSFNFPVSIGHACYARRNPNFIFGPIFS
jgi:hypothetical protein